MTRIGEIGIACNFLSRVEHTTKLGIGGKTNRNFVQLEARFLASAQQLVTNFTG
jgi:hypothetical protein